MANFSLLAKLGLDSKGFQKGLSKAKAGVSKFGKSVLNVSNRLAKMGLGAAAAGFALLSKNAIALGSELSDIAANTNFATREFQVFRGALIDAGGSTTSMEKAIVAMQKAIVQGSEGLTTYIRGFDRLGLNIDDIKAMKPEDQFMAIGKAIAGAENQQEALTSAVEIFGQRNAGRLIEVFKRLDKEGYGKMAKDIEKTYGIMDAETQKALDKAADTIERFKNKATIKVGELIAGEAGGAALKILGLQILKAASNLGVGMINGIMDSLAFARNAFGAFADFFFDKMSSTIGLIGTLMKIKLSEAVNPIIKTLNQIPGIDIGLIDTDKLHEDLDKGLEKGAKSFGEHLQDRTEDQEDFDMKDRFGYDPAKFYDDEIARQEALLKKSRETKEEIDDIKSGPEGDPPKSEGEGDPPKTEGEGEGDLPKPEGEGDPPKELEEADKKSSLTGHDLKKAANIAGKEDGIRFEKLGSGGFQQFINGRKGDVFTEEQMQAGLQKQIDKDGTEGLLEKINATLEGKFVSQ